MDSLWHKIRSEPVRQNLVNESGNRVTGERSIIKTYTIIALTGLLAFGAGFLMKIHMFGQGMLALVIFITLLVVQALVLRNKKEILIACLISSSFFVAPFVFNDPIYSLVTGFLLFGLFTLAHLRGRGQVENTVRLKFHYMARPVIGIVLIAAVLAVTFAVLIDGETLFSESGTNRMIDIFVSPFMRGQAESFSSGSSLDSVLADLAHNQIAQANEIQELEPQDLEVLVSRQKEIMVKYIEDKIDFSPDLEATIGENVYTLISTKAVGAYSERGYLSAVIVFLILLLLVKSIEVILYPPLALLGFMWYELLIAFGLITIQFESRNKEVISIV